MKPIAFLLLIAFAQALAQAQTATLSNIFYKGSEVTDAYERERCVLDVYLPVEEKKSPVLVWFHGGGLTGGSKDGKDTVKIASSLAEEGIAVVVPNYRLSPKAKNPAYLDDAAAAVAWTVRHIAGHGGDPKRVFVGGHSAGGYLTLMIGMDARRLAPHRLKPRDLAGLIPVSGQTMTHYTLRAEQGLGRFSVTADEDAPVRYAAGKNLPPMLIIWAENDMAARAEENAYLLALLKGAEQSHVSGHEIPGRDHGSVGHRIAEKDDPARKLLLQFIDNPKSK